MKYREGSQNVYEEFSGPVPATSRRVSDDLRRVIGRRGESRSFEEAVPSRYAAYCDCGDD
jgi:hypothetical protein